MIPKIDEINPIIDVIELNTLLRGIVEGLFSLEKIIENIIVKMDKTPKFVTPVIRISLRSSYIALGNSPYKSLYKP